MDGAIAIVAVPVGGGRESEGNRVDAERLGVVEGEGEEAEGKNGKLSVTLGGGGSGRNVGF